MEYLLTVLGIVLVVLLPSLYNLLKKVEIYEDTITNYENIILNQQEYIKRISNIVGESRKLISEIDEKGMFEADDEVGDFFRLLKDIQDTLSNFIITEINGQNQKQS
jgi:predicted translin family RNA/ssDNA-binding protein